jgi:curved DNA-binding protein CbpA
VDDERDAYRVLQVLPDANDAVIRAAYRALAGLWHPDRDASARATRRMAELNAAYDQVRTPDRREAYDRLRRLKAQPRASPIVVTPPPGASSAQRRSSDGSSGSGTIDFGRYAGWTLRQLARHDPDYLRWLSRHSSGIRFRRQIEELLSDTEQARPVASAQRRR